MRNKLALRDLAYRDPSIDPPGLMLIGLARSGNLRRTHNEMALIPSGGYRHWNSTVQERGGEAQAPHPLVIG
jgi:hypothetical protein